MSRIHPHRSGGLQIAILSLIVTFMSACAAVGDPTPQTVTLKYGYNGYYSCYDTYLNQSNPDYNYGDYIHVYVRDNGTTDDRDGLIKFDLTGQLPTGACIKSAKLRMYQCETWNLEWMNIAAYRVLKEWTEGTGGTLAGACWYYRTSGTSNQWSGWGCRGVNTDRHDTYDDVVYCTPGDKWYEWDVTPSVQYGWANPSKNYGLCLDVTSSYNAEDGVSLRSSQHGTEEHHPELVITYVVPTAEPEVPLMLTDFSASSYNYWNTDPNITMYPQADGQLKCAGTTSDSIWGHDGSATGTANSSFEASVKVKLEQGIVGVDQGLFRFGMYMPSVNQYLSLCSVGFSAQYYEMSGLCAATGNGERHDGSGYWSSYWDDDYPAGPPSAAVRFFSQTPENEQASYLTYKLRYDKTNGMFYVFVNDVLVTYYSNVNFTNWRLGVAHDNDRTSVPTTVWTDFLDTTPPTPNPMTWLTAPHAESTNSIHMIATTASDLVHPAITYYFTGLSGGHSNGWTSNTDYTDVSLSANTQYGYKVKARDSAQPPNATTDSTSVYVYTLMPRPTGCSASSVTATTVDLALIGTLPNLTQGQSGILFYSPTLGGNGGINEWIQVTTDQATGLTPNTQYSFQVKARNGNAIETLWGLTTASIRTLAAEPQPLPYGPVACQGIQANWDANGNPGGTKYFCEETVTGRNSGWITGTSWLLMGLTPDTEYRFRVKARNGDLPPKETGWVDLGPVLTNLSIGMVKLRYRPGNPDLIPLPNKVVTAVFKNERLFFIQDFPIFGQPDGAGGIAVRCDEIMPPVEEGFLVDIVGTLALNDPPYDRELIILPLNVRPGLPAFPPMPYSGNGRHLGGGDFGSQAGVYDDVTANPLVPSSGTNVIGMLVRAWGTVYDDGQGGAEYVWIDDGSRLNDGNTLGNPGICVDVRSIGGMPQPTRYCLVTGIMRCWMVDYNGERCNVRVLWPRKPDDITPLR